MRHPRKLLVLLASVAILTVAGRAEAGLIPTNVSVTPDGDNFRWTYAVVVTTDVKVNPGDYFTIYDFGGLVGGPTGSGDGPGTIVAPIDWQFATELTGPTPAGTGPNDNPAIPNITFKYMGATPIEGQVGLGNFMANSTFGEGTTSDFTSITHRQVDGRSEANITTTDVPVPGSIGETPEPATLIMLGLAVPFAGLGSFLRRRMRNG